MNATIHAIGKHSNGDLCHAVATHSMDVLDAAYHTAHSYPGGVPALAQRMPHFVNARGELTAMSASTLQHKVNPNCPTHNLTLRESRDMMALSQNYSILHALSAELGHVSLRIAATYEGATLEHVMRATKEFGDVLSSVSESQKAASSGGSKVTPNELRIIEREAAELIGALNGMLASLRAQQGGAE